MSHLDTILAQPKITHDLEQGSDAWHAFRLEHDGASEAAAMLGLSKTVQRNELLHAKHTGLPREFSDFVQKRVLDNGHAVEALARPIVEAELGEDLYPVTCSRGRMSASCDGLTLDDATAFEHKQWNEDLAALVRQGIVPDEHQPQCQQIMLVTGAQRVKFVVSDGTAERMASAIVTPDPAWWERIAAGWAQFHTDRATYVPPAAAPVVVAAPVTALPAVSVQVSGAIDIIDNFKVFETALRDFIEHRLIREPSSDQDFADLDSQIKALKGAEAALDAAEAQMLAQVASVDAIKRTKDMLHKLTRDNRLVAEKLLASEKERRRGEIVTKARAAYEAHVDSLKADTGGPWIVLPAPDFAGKVKGLRTIASIQNAVDTELAAGKIVADESARKIRAALACMAEDGKGYEFLLADRLALIGKPVDDLRAIIKGRIAEHQAAEAKKETDTRERIRKEEAEKLQRAQREAQEAEDALIASFDSNARRIEHDSVPYIQKAIGTYESVAKDWENDPRPRVLAAFLAGRAYLKERLESAQARQAAQAATPAPVATQASITAAPATLGTYPPSTASAPMSPNVVPLGTRAPAQPATPPTLTLGAIGERLGFVVTAEFIKRMGFEGTKVRTSTLFHEADVPRIIDSIVAHLRSVQHELQAA